MPEIPSDESSWSEQDLAARKIQRFIRKNTDLNKTINENSRPGMRNVPLLEETCLCFQDHETHICPRKFATSAC